MEIFYCLLQVSQGNMQEGHELNVKMCYGDIEA